jgi:iron complex outermembrane receptor protein
MSLNSNKTHSVKLRAAIAMLCAAAAVPANRAQAADAAAPADTLDEVIVTGSRTSGVKAADSPAPIQILSSEALAAASGNPDLQNALAQLVPSLTLQAFGFDMAGQTLQVKLRGLSPNHVLVLINGKRRHTTANLAVDTGSVYQGGAGADLNFIPLDAIDHIEVLTDGAAAQYGTDAIAGVINIILKKNNSGGQVHGTWGNYFNGGGNTNDVAGNAGFEPADGAFLNITAENRGHGHSNQGAIDERVTNPAILGTYPGSNMPNAPGYPYLNQISGDGESHLKTFLINTGFDFEGGTEAYAFVTYGDKKAASYENYRLPGKVAYTDPETDVTTYPFPYGFNPQEADTEKDSAETLGVKGSIVDWNWDVSSTYGVDKLDIYTLNSYNAGTYNTTGVPSITNFYDGYLQASQWTNNLDINKNFDVGLAGPLNVAFGAEYRRETYSIGAGVPLSYLLGGAQSYPGFSPTDAGTHSRKNYAGYVDFNVKPIAGLLIDAAGRYEHYSDFGDAKVGKLTTRYDFDPTFALRGTVSNGFRAPTLAEEYYSSTNVGPTTAFVQLPPNSAGGKLLGLGDGLDPEKSVNLSVGLVWRPIAGMSTTLDLYQIQVTNRIVGSGSVIGSSGGVVFSPAVNAAIAANGNQLDPDVVAHGTTGINVFANGIDTSTRGADLQFDFPVEYPFGKVDWTIGATYNSTHITRLPGSPPELGQNLYDAQAISDLTTASPRYVVNLGGLWNYNKITVNLVEKIYGPAEEYQNDDGDNPTGNFEYFESRIGVTAITNLNISYQLQEHFSVDVGAQNLFNKFPGKLNGTQLAHEDNPAYEDNAGVTQYPIFSPFGINGGFYYVKATFKW